MVIYSDDDLQHVQAVKIMPDLTVLFIEGVPACAQA